MALVNCSECSKEISDKAESCPHCGCPVIENSNKNTTQQVEVTGVNITPKNPARTKKVIAGIVLAIVAIVSIWGGVTIRNAAKLREAKNQYIDDLNTISYAMLVSGADAEGLCNLTYKVWNNTIRKVKSSDTDKFTTILGNGNTFHTDFNTSLTNLYTDNDTVNTVSKIEEGQKSVDELMKSMQDPPEGLERCYDTLEEMYSSYKGITDLAVNPTGSLTSFSEGKNTKTEKFMEFYNKLKNQTPEKDPPDDLTSKVK